MAYADARGGGKGRAGPSSRSYDKSNEGASKNRATIRRKRNAKKRAAEAEEDGNDEADGEESIGVNKVKAALRQTKRLLAKDKLSALSRQDAERRLAALEDELERRTNAQKERKNAQRYHKVRFFERQKLTRRIGKAKRRLAENDLSDEHKKEAEDELATSRILLNYVLHFPMTQKYVALFPNTGPSPLDEQGADDDDESNASRERMRKVQAQIIEAMKKEELIAEPEIELQMRAQTESTNNTGKRKMISAGAISTAKVSKQKKADKPSEAEKSNLQDDDFFA